MEVEDNKSLPPYYLNIEWFERIKTRYALVVLDEYLVAEEATRYSEELDEVLHEFALTWIWYSNDGLHGMYLGATNFENLQKMNSVYRVYTRML